MTLFVMKLTDGFYSHLNAYEDYNLTTWKQVRDISDVE